MYTVATFKLILFLDVVLCLSFWLEIIFCMLIFAGMTMEFVSNVLKRYVNLNFDSIESKAKKAEEAVMPDLVLKAEEDVKLNLSIISNSSAKATQSRDSLFRLLDPLYDSEIHGISPDQNQNNPALKGDYNKVISVNEGAETTLITYNRIKDDGCNIETLHPFKARMDDVIDEKMKLEQELNELKLELNQLQQERTSLQLELHQKEEVILKIQGEAQKLGNQCKQEIKQLQDKLNTINEQNNNEEVKILREEISKLKDRDVQLNEKNDKLVIQIAALENSVRNYETTLDRVIKESEKLRIEHDNTKKHLATLEVSFSDVHAKYERTKEFVVAYKNNEEVLAHHLEKSEDVARRYEERYETLKAHAKAQIDKANKELSAVKDKHQLEMNKMTAIIRRLEIKTGSIQQALDQKTKECADLAALCDEMAA